MPGSRFFTLFPLSEEIRLHIKSYDIISLSMTAEMRATSKETQAFYRKFLKNISITAKFRVKIMTLKGKKSTWM